MAALPPGPRLPALLQTALLVLRPEAALGRWRRRYGDVFTVRSLLSGRVVFVADPAVIKDVFTGPPDLLRAGEANAFLAPLLGERSVLVLDGPEHLRQRRLLLPPFHGERMRRYEEAMREAANADVDTWPVGRPFALLEHMQAVTLDVIARAVFGLGADDPDGAELRRRLRRMLEPVSNRARLLLVAVSGGLLGGDGFDARLRARISEADELLFALIARRRADPRLAEREDICALLLQATDEHGAPMTDAEVRDELMTLLTAGHETTATALAWAFERLLRTPGVLAELRRSLADEDDDAYLDAVVKETLRLRPVVPNVARVLHADHRVGDWTLPAGVAVAPSIVLTHARADRYPAPREFRPERFLGEGAPDTYTWLPFGGGPRRCIGAAFAMFEMRTVLRTVLERTTLEAVGRRGEKTRRTGVTLQPARGTRVIQRRPPLQRAAEDALAAEPAAAR